MSALELFHLYLGSVERRLKWMSLARGAAAVAALLLVVTLAAAAYALREAFAPGALLAGRFSLALAAGASVVLALIVPMLRITRRRAALLVEEKVLGLDERATTLAGPGAASPLAELVAEEALAYTCAAPPHVLVSARILALFAAAAAAVTGILFWLAAAAPGTLGYGAHLLWAGAPPTGHGILFELQVKPGNAKVRRGGDQLIEALAPGFEAGAARLRIRRSGAAQWESLVMAPHPAGPGHAFLLTGLTADVEYRVEAQRMRSPLYRLSVVDLPAVEKIRVRYRYPAYLGLPEKVEDPGGDVRAVEGTRAEIEVETSLPLSQGVLVLDDGSRIRLGQGQGRASKATIELARDGSYYVAALDGSAVVRLSEDYFIEAQAEKAPEVRITRPGRDAKVSPIEEISVEVEASDDYGLQELELKYTVNGGEERSMRLPLKKGGLQAQQRATIALEDFKLQPGDIVGLAASARDARTTSQTGIYFLEAQPFEREYQQSQAMGGMGGGEGGQQDDVAQRQKEIIAATWNQIRSPKARAQAQEDAAFLAGVQQKLAGQAKSLAERMRSRQLASTNEEFQKFSKEMTEAAKAMEEATRRLTGRKWRDALSPEQQALQHLLRAQSMFRQIQVAFGQRGGGGGGGGGQMRDLESLFELELDTEKNQYETAQSASGGNERERQIDEALKKLEDLARRQQQAAEQRQRREQGFQQRWAQEMLRREAEQLRRQVEALQRGEQGQTPGSGSPQSGSQQGASRQGGSLQRAGGGQSSSSARLDRAGQQLERAIEEMRRSQSAQGGQAAENARRAAERMSQALDELSSMRRQQSSGRMQQLSERSASLAERQRKYEEQVREKFPQAAGNTGQPGQSAVLAGELDRLAREKEAMQREYQRLEQSLRDTARALQGTQRSAASRLREALGEAQQNELELRLKLGAEWMKRGLGQYLAPRERVVTEALEKLHEQVEQAREMAGRESSPGGREGAERTLSRIEGLRARLADGVRNSGEQGKGNGQGKQPGRGQQGRGGAGGQGREGEAGRARQSGGESFSRGDYGALNDGSLRAGWQERNGGGDPRSAWLDALLQMRELRQQGGMSDETQAELDRLLRQMERLDPARFGGPVLAGRIEGEVLPQLEQLELRLRREAEGGAAQPRAVAPSKAPPGYGEAVAEYFRRLSRGK